MEVYQGTDEQSVNFRVFSQSFPDKKIDFIMFVLILKFLLGFICFIVGFFLLDILYYYIKDYKKYKVSTDPVVFKKTPFLVSFLLDFPRVFAHDLLQHDPNDFKDVGLILFEGCQGSGKTMAMTHYCNILKSKYPDLMVLTNYGLLFEDGGLEDWRPIVGDLNGRSGLCSCFDEISLWFNNRNYANFDFNFLRCIVQNRKEHRLILGTCQQINMVDKNIRRQCTEVRKCRTFFGCVTVVWRFRPVFSGDGDIQRLISKGIYAFIQTEDLRYQYDTFRVVENLGKVGFNERERLK